MSTHPSRWGILANEPGIAKYKVFSLRSLFKSPIARFKPSLNDIRTY